MQNDAKARFDRSLWCIISTGVGENDPESAYAPAPGRKHLIRVKYKLIFPVICGPLRAFLQVTMVSSVASALLRTWRAASMLAQHRSDRTDNFELRLCLRRRY